MTIQAPRHSISLTRRIEATPAKIYAAWTEPETMARWLGKVAADVRVGGRYRFESPAPGGTTYIYTGEYLVLEENRRVAQTFLAGEPDPHAPRPYHNEFIEIQIRRLEGSASEVSFVNGWDGDSIGEDGEAAAKAAWSQWLDQMEQAVLKS